MKVQEKIYNSNLLNRCPTISEESLMRIRIIVKLRQGSGKKRQGMALKAKGLKA